MENKDQNNTGPLADALHEAPLNGGVVKEPPDLNALSLEPTLGRPLISQEQRKGQVHGFRRFARRLDYILAALLLITGVVVAFNIIRSDKNESERANTAVGNFGTVGIPLEDLLEGKSLDISGAANVTINGPMQLNDDFILAPSLQPTGAKAGQIYFDSTTNQLAYFNGEVFVFLTSPSVTPGDLQSLTRVVSLGGASGDLTLGGGLVISDNQINNTGVLSVQGQSGDIALTAGAGIVINGTNFSNSGVLSVASGSPNVSVANDGAGNITLSVTSGAGTITSSGGTSGTVPVFTASQNLEDSIITQSGLTVTISGDLSIVTGGLTLSNALTVSNGGTGATSFGVNGVLVGNGTAAISSVAAGSPGLCLLSTAGAPAWGACPSGSGVVSLNSLTGALNIANASAAGNTVTIDDASTVNKGIASFNGTNFAVTGGTVNTIQDIDSTSTPTFVGVNTNSITPGAALTVGISAQTALLQGSTTTITSNGAGNDIVLNSADTIELQDSTNVTGDLGVSGGLAANGGSITSTGALNITPGGTLTVGVASQTLALQGGSGTTFRSTSGANTTIIGFTSPTANTTLNFPALAAGTYTICTTSGNCAAAATTLQGAYDNSTSPEIVLDVTRGALTIRDNASPLAANLLEVQNNAGSTTYLAVTAAGTTVTGTATISGSINTTGGALQTNSTTRIDNVGNVINIVDVVAGGDAAFQGGDVTIGSTSQAGDLILSDGSSNIGTLQTAALGQNTTYILPDPSIATATICLTTGNCAGTGGGVTTGGGTTNRLAKFTGAQAIGDSTISDDGTNVTVSVDVIVQGGDLTLGTTSQAASVVLHDGNGQTTTLQAGDSTGNLTFILPANAGVANQCLKQSGVGNQLVWQDCDGGAGGSSATLQTAYDNSILNPEITLNGSVGGLTIRDNSTPIGNVLFNIQDNTGATNYLAVTVNGIDVEGGVEVSGNINSSGAGIQTSGTTRIDNTGNLVSIGNITGSGPITIASIGVGNDITVDGADQFIVQDTSVFNALATFNSNIDLGTSDLVGTTSDINLTNFDVTGATGNVTAGTYNGQTISGSANFTGSVTVATNLTLTAGDIAVNGGDITSSGALNITPAGTLTVGATGQQLILQGDASTQLTATGGGFTTTLGFNGIPTGNVAFNFDRAAVPGTYTICTTVGNCAGTGGGVTTSGGTTGTLAKFTGAQTLGDSLLSESGSTVTVNGNLNLISGNEFRVNGTQISSANLSNDANLAKLGASQTFTGNTVAFQNGTNSTNAFNIQNAAGTRVLTVDTTNGQVVLGIGSSLDGRLVFNSVSSVNTVTLVPGILTGSRTLTLPDASGIICTDSGNCAGAGATLQTAYNFSVGGTTPKIKVNSSLGGVDIQDADTTIGANLFNVRASNGSGLGSVMFGIGSAGDVTLQNSANSTAAFRLLTQGGTSVLRGDTTNGEIILGQSGTLSGSLVFNNATNANTTTITVAAPSVNRTITLPDATGTICLTSGNCVGVGGGVTTVGGTTNRLPVFNGSQTIIDSWLLQNSSTLELDSGRNLSLLGGDLSVIGAGSFSSTLTVQGDTLVRPTGGTTTALRVQNATNQNVLRVDTTNGAAILGQANLQGQLLINDGGASGFGLTVAATGLEASGASRSLSLDATNLTANRTLVLPDASGTICLQGSTGCGFAADSGDADYIQNRVTAQAANFYVQAATSGSVAGVIQANAAGSGNILDLRNGSGTNIATFSSIGSVLLRNSFDSINALTVQNALGTATLFNVDASNERVGVGGVASFSKFEVIGGDVAIYNSGNNPRLILGDSTTAGQNGFLQWDSTNDYFRIETVGTNGLKINDNYVAIGNIFPDQPLKVGNGSTLLYQISTTGAVLSQNSTDSTAAFRVLNASSVPLFVTDTTNSRVYIGNPTNDATGALLVLDSYNNATDPTGANGGMYYNSNTGKFRCYENGVWKNCLGLTETITIFGQNGAGASSQWDNMPAALTEFMSGTGVVTSPSSRLRYDFTQAEQVRFIVNTMVVGSANAEIRIQYSTDLTTWNYLDSANTGIGQNVSATGLDVSGWTDIASGAKGDVYTRVVGINGDGVADPRFGLVQLQIR